MTISDVSIQPDVLKGTLAPQPKPDTYIEGIRNLLKQNNWKYKPEWVEETSTSFRARVEDPSTYLPESFRTVDFNPNKEIKAVMGKRKKGGSMKIQTYIFPKEGYSKESVATWLNGGHVPANNSEQPAQQDTTSAPEVWELVFDGEQSPDSNWKSEEVIAEVAQNYDPNYHQAPIFLDHEAGKASGWVDKVKNVGQKLYATFKEFTEEGKRLIKSLEYKFKSASLIKYPNKGAYLQEVSLTNLPKVKGLEPIQASQYSENINETQYQSNDKENDMTPEQMQMYADKVNELAKIVEELKGMMATKDAELAEKDVAIAEKDEAMKAQEGEMKQYSERLRKVEYKDKINDWMVKGRVTPAQVEAYGGLDKMVATLATNFSEKQLDAMAGMFVPEQHSDMLKKVTTTESSIATTFSESNIPKSIAALIAREGNRPIGNVEQYNEIMAYGKEIKATNFHEALTAYVKK